MSRISDNYIAWLLGQSNYRAIALVKIPDFDNPVYLHTGIGRYFFEGNRYESVGGLGGIDSVEENGELDPTRIKLTLSGLPYDADTSEYLLEDNYQNKEVTIYLALLDDNNQIINNPLVMFVGYTGNVNIKTGATATISIDVIDELTMWNKKQTWRYNDETQQRLYPADTSLQYIFNTNKSLQWRSAPNS